jgi:hypothetical protein
MGIRAILMSLFGAGSGRTGVWDFLSTHSEGKRRVDLQRELNEGTLRAIRELRPGMVLREGGPDWVREISMPGTVLPNLLFTATPATPQFPAVELKAAEPLTPLSAGSEGEPPSE